MSWKENVPRHSCKVVWTHCSERFRGLFHFFESEPKMSWIEKQRENNICGLPPLQTAHVVSALWKWEVEGGVIIRYVILVCFIRNIEYGMLRHKTHPFHCDILPVLYNTVRIQFFAHRNRDEATFQYFRNWRQSLIPTWWRTCCCCKLTGRALAKRSETCLINVYDGWKSKKCDRYQTCSTFCGNVFLSTMHPCRLVQLLIYHNQ